MAAGHNQYAPMAGLPELRARLSTRAADSTGQRADPDTEITITAGATEALFCAIQALLHPGDEALVLDPAYDSYAPAVTLAGAKLKRVALAFDPDTLEFGIDWEQLCTVMHVGAALTRCYDRAARADTSAMRESLQRIEQELGRRTRERHKNEQQEPSAQ